MAPRDPDPSLPIHSAFNSGPDTDEPQYPIPLKSSGALEGFLFEETTPAIGREYPTVNIVDDLLNAPNSDDLVRDLAITSKYQLLFLNLGDWKSDAQLSSLSTGCRIFPRPKQSHRRVAEAAGAPFRATNRQTRDLDPAHSPGAQQHQ